MKHFASISSAPDKGDVRVSVGELVDSGGGLNRIASISVAHQAAPERTGTLPKMVLVAHPIYHLQLLTL